jgi:hypothetical protein
MSAVLATCFFGGTTLEYQKIENSME